MEHGHVWRAICGPEGKQGDGIKCSIKAGMARLYHKRQARCGSGRSEIVCDAKGKYRPVPRSNDSKSGWKSRGPVDPSVEKQAADKVAGIGYRIVANKKKHVVLFRRVKLSHPL